MLQEKILKVLISIVANVNGNTFSLELGVDNKIWHY